MSFIQNLRLRQKLLLLIGLLSVVVAVISFTQWKLAGLSDAVNSAYQKRYDSYMLADELRQSSDDLTRLVRIYVETGDPKWEKQYNDIIEIRNGAKPRPAGYTGIYWDFISAGIPVPGQVGPAIALLEMMRQAGFTEAELGKLNEAASKSAALVRIETTAMNLIKGLEPDGKGGFVRGESDHDTAQDLVNNEEYHRIKAQIMEPVNESALKYSFQA